MKFDAKLIVPAVSNTFVFYGLKSMNVNKWLAAFLGALVFGVVYYVMIARVKTNA